MKKRETHLRFTALLAELSADFVRFSMGEINQRILQSLQKIAENLDHVTLGELTPDGQALRPFSLPRVWRKDQDKKEGL